MRSRHRRSLRRSRSFGSRGWRTAAKRCERQAILRRFDPAAHLAERLAAEHDLVPVLEERALCRPPTRTGSAPFQVSSIRLPSLPRSPPEIVPDAIRSPVRMLAPFEVACASCCGIVQ